RRIDKEMSAEARKMFSAFIPDGDMGTFATNLPHALRRHFTLAMSLLRREDFQKLLVNYPRALRAFFIAEGAQDTVSSEWHVRGADGKEYKPGDYLAAFAT